MQYPLYQIFVHCHIQIKLSAWQTHYSIRRDKTLRAHLEQCGIRWPDLRLTIPIEHSSLTASLPEDGFFKHYFLVVVRFHRTHVTPKIFSHAPSSSSQQMFFPAFQFSIDSSITLTRSERVGILPVSMVKRRLSGAGT